MPHAPTVKTSDRTNGSRWQGEYDPYAPSAEDATSPTTPEKGDPIVLSPLRRKASSPTPPFDRSSGLRGVFFERPLFGVLFIVVPFLLALLAAVGHHLVNAYLDGRDVGQTTNLVVGGTTLSANWAVSVGTAFAFLFKAALAASIAAAFWQRLWRVARKHDISVESYDALFGILHSPLPFFRSALWSAALSLAIISVLSWLIPVATIFTPGSIKTVVQPSQATDSCKLPATGRFRFGTTYPPDTRDVALHIIDGSYVGPSTMAINLFHRTFVGQAEVPWLSPCPEAAEQCEYSVTFDGLGADCDADAFDPQELIQQSAYTWYASRTRGVVKSPSDSDVQRGLVDGAIIETNEQSNDTIQWTQTVLELAWLHAPVGNESGSTYRSLRCVPTNTTYTINVVEKSGSQKAHLQSQKRNGLVVGAGFSLESSNPVDAIRSADRLSDPVAAMFDTLTTEITSPYFNQTSGNTGAKFGNIRRIPNLGHVGTLDVNTNLAYSSQFVIVNPGSNNVVFGDFARLIPELAYNMSLSVFSLGFNTTAGACSVTTTRHKYTYARLTLWLPYGLALALALPVLVMGLFALYENKRAAPGVNTFSLLLESTRGRTLHTLFADPNDATASGVKGSEDRDLEIRQRVRSTVLRYGLHDHDKHGVFEVAETGRGDREPTTHGLLPELLA